MNTLAKKDDKRYEYFIYKLYNPDCNFIYVGSTRDITTRKNKHKSACNKPNDKAYNQKKYQTIRDHGGFENWYMVVLEVMPDVTKMTAEMQEDCYRVDLNATMNSKRATRGDISIEEYNKQRYIDNRETILARVTQYQIDNREHYQEYQNKYYQDNKETLLEYKKQYRINNKELITQKHTCDCGGKYTHEHKSTHIKTLKHQKYISTLNIL